MILLVHIIVNIHKKVNNQDLRVHGRRYLDNYLRIKDLAKATLTLIPLFGVITFISILIPFNFIDEERRMVLKRIFQALESLTGGIVKGDVIYHRVA